MNVEEAIRSRRSVKSYDTSYELDDATLRRIFELVERTPSSFNLQHWRFVVVRAQERKDQLRAASFGQPHVGECAAVVVVAAKLNAHDDAEASQAHVSDDALRKKLCEEIRGYYENNPQFQRDEALRSASLAAMTLMLVAESMGLCTCPMIGFNPKKVSEIVELAEGVFPVMLMVLGKLGEGDAFPTSRFPLSEVVKLETFTGKGL